MTASAPPAMALITPRKSKSRPSTSTTTAHRRAVAMSFMRSIIVVAVFSAVSTPMEIGAWDIVVYGGGDAHRGQAEFVERQPAGEAPSASDHDEPLGSRVAQYLHRPLFALLFLLEVG